MRLFSEQNELILFSKNFILSKVITLEKDVRHCLLEKSQYTPDAPAPFPALLFCFSPIDLLGALYSGNATSEPGVSSRSRDYMQKFMHYTEEQSKLLQDVFRHKLVHLAEPGPVIKDKKERRISWVEYHNNGGKHLKFDKLSTETKIQDIPYLQVDIKVDHIFNISIIHLVQNIKDSVTSPNGYLATLERTPELQDKFE